VPGLVVKVIESKVNAWFIGMVLMLAILTLAFACLIGADIVIYRRYFRPVGVSAKPQ
jgi:hypothetical protein